MKNKIMNVFDNIPFIKLKIASGRFFIDFKIDDTFSITDQNGNIIEQDITTDLKWHLKIENFKDERNTYSFLVCLYKNKNSATILVNKLRRQNYAARLQRIGNIININNNKVDCTFYRVLVGEYNCLNDALNSKYFRMQEFKPTIIKERIRKSKGHFELCDEKINRVFKINNSLNIVTSKPETNILIYNPLNNSADNDNKQLNVQGNTEFKIGQNKSIEIIKKVTLEDYVKNIVFHELGNDFHLNTLKSQAVISRNNILLHLGTINDRDYHFSDENYIGYKKTPKNDINKIEKAVDGTKGELFFNNGNLYNIPYCKSCGGYLNDDYEIYEDVIFDFLKKGQDTDNDSVNKKFYLKSEKKLSNWINQKPDVFCNPESFSADSPLMKCNNFFRWSISFTRSELEDIINQDLDGYNIGILFDIIPIKRNQCGRITEIEVLGSRNNLKLNKNYDICSILFRNIIPSNCFVIDKEIGKNGIISKFIFRGAGKGHGTGLCQSGAEVLAEQNKSYEQILEQYFSNMVINRIY